MSDNVKEIDKIIGAAEDLNMELTINTGSFSSERERQEYMESCIREILKTARDLRKSFTNTAK